MREELDEKEEIVGDLEMAITKIKNEVNKSNAQLQEAERKLADAENVAENKGANNERFPSSFSPLYSLNYPSILFSFLISYPPPLLSLPRFQEELDTQARKIRELERNNKELEEELKSTETDLEQLEEKYAKVTRGLKKYQREYKKLQTLQKAGGDRFAFPPPFSFLFFPFPFPTISNLPSQQRRCCRRSQDLDGRC